MKTEAITIRQNGGPEVLTLEEIDVAVPQAGEALVEHEAIGVNFIDVYHRTGFYPVPLPLIPGSEGAGHVVEVGPGVTDLKAGDRVAYGLGTPGAYARRRIIAVDRLVPLPKEISSTTAAAVMLKGLTAEYLLRRTRPVKAGDAIVFHAAAGGTGSIATQWAKALGATVIGLVGNPEKIETARKNGCDHVLLSREPFAGRVRDLTGGHGVSVVYDSIGRDTFDESLACLAPFGFMVLFGQASGPVPPFEISRLQKGSLFLTRPTLFTYDARRADLVAGAAAMFDVIQSGLVRVAEPAVFPLARAADAHRALESRRTTGSLVLVP